MSTKPKYYIVESSALPEVFLKVAEAKRLLSTGEASTVNEATRMTDISRSAFYKYRDAVLPFQSMMTGRIITFQLLLHDEQGLLSEILGVFADAGANISTINSIVPTNGTAVVTISAETIDLTMTLDEPVSEIYFLPANSDSAPKKLTVTLDDGTAEHHLVRVRHAAQRNSLSAHCQDA